MSTVKACPFCHLKSGILLQNNLAVAFLSDPRKVKGHFLVTTKRHIEQPWSMTPEELQSVYELIFKIEQAFVGKLGTGLDIRQNYRPFMEQDRLKVDHIHYHVLPRAKFDRIYDVAERYDTVLFKKLTNQEQTDISNLLG